MAKLEWAVATIGNEGVVYVTPDGGRTLSRASAKVMSLAEAEEVAKGLSDHDSRRRWYVIGWVVESV